VTAALARSEYHAALRTDFYSFMLRCFADLNAGAAYLPSWHIEVMAAKLQSVRDGRVRRLIVNIPPRHLKSLAASIALPAWLLGHDPTLGIINVTYGQELSDKFARDCRAIMMSAWYRAMFSTRLASARASLQEPATTRGGFRMATSVGGVLTGRGADLILIDDPMKPSDAMSESRRTGANEWFEIAPSDRQSATGRRPHLFCDLRVGSSYRLLCNCGAGGLLRRSPVPPLARSQARAA